MFPRGQTGNLKGAEERRSSRPASFPYSATAAVMLT
jgi:hypothetical protein